MKEFLTQLRSWLEQQYANYKLAGAIRRQAEIRIVIGAGNTVYDGFVSTDYPQLDICRAASFSKYLRKQTVGVFVAEHVWEHLSPEDAAQACYNCYVYLKHNGKLRIAVPDGFHSDADYIDQVKPGGYGVGSDDHKVLYNYRTLSAMLEKTGYRVRLLEWFDEQGKFHHESWNVEDGPIRRSSQFDPRNRQNPTSYTSLIIDAIKP